MRSRSHAPLAFSLGCWLLLNGFYLSTPAQAQSTNDVLVGPGHSTRAIRIEPGGPSCLEGEILIKFKPGASDTLVTDVIRRAAVTGIQHLLTPAMRDQGDIGITRVTIALPVPQALQVLQNHPALEFAQPNWVYQHQGGSTPPTTFDDPFFQNGSLWGVYDSTDTATATRNAYGSAAVAAWIAGYTGSDQVYVGVIDEGIDFNHPDLRDNIWTNPGEIPGDGVDNDGNGYIDDVHGWNAINNSGNIYDAGYDDHGTHVAGTIGAIGANGLGMSGINWHVSIISGKFLGPNDGSTADAIKAIDYMTNLKNKGINIVALNNSWGGGGYDPGLLDAIKRAAQQEILFIAAAGNGNWAGLAINLDRTPYYPACYDTTKAGLPYDTVIAVTAIDSAGAKASWANYGKVTVDLGAPGVSVFSTLPGGSFGSYDGTSMATPHVTGAIALFASIYPQATAAQIRAALLSSTTYTPSLDGKAVSKGRLDVNRFLGLPIVSSISTPNAPALVSAEAVSSSQIEVTWSDLSDNETGFRIVRSEGAIPSWSTIVGANRSSYVDQGLSPNTTYIYQVYAYNAGGESVSAGTVSATTQSAPPPAGEAKFVRRDSTTQGSWIGKFGTQGWEIMGDSHSYPATLTLTTNYAAS